MPKPGVSNNIDGDLTADAKARRDPIEEALAVVNRMLIDVDELSIRIGQAMRRAAVVAPVLLPAQERLAQMRAYIATLRDDLGAYWAAGQAHRWQ